MAHNRIYMRCKACGAALYLGKTLADGYCYGEYDKGVTLVDKLNKFYEEETFL